MDLKLVKIEGLRIHPDRPFVGKPDPRSCDSQPEFAGLARNTVAVFKGFATADARLSVILEIDRGGAESRRQVRAKGPRRHRAVTNELIYIANVKPRRARPRVQLAVLREAHFEPQPVGELQLPRLPVNAGQKFSSARSESFVCRWKLLIPQYREIVGSIYGLNTNVTLKPICYSLQARASALQPGIRRFHLLSHRAADEEEQNESHHL